MKRDAYNKAPTKKLGRTAVLSVKPACIHCKRPVGTIFSNRIDNKYTILCGDNENPCKLNVQIFNGGGTYFEDLLYTFRDHLDEIKVRIIRQKLDTIFSYVSEEKSIELFKKELQTYNSDSNIYKELLDVYTDYYHNKQNKEKAIKKNQIIFGLNEKVQLLMEEYEQTQNPELYKEQCEAAHKWVHSEEAMMTAKHMSENVIEGIDETFAKFEPRHRFELIQLETPKQPKHYVKHAIAK
jgi:hypothetical protein